MRSMQVKNLYGDEKVFQLNLVREERLCERVAGRESMRRNPTIAAPLGHGLRQGGCATCKRLFQ